MKKRFKILLITGIVIAVPHIVSMLTLDRIIEYKHVEFYHEYITAEMDGYKIAFVTDTHDLTTRQFREMVAELDALEIDLLLLGGDYTSKRHTLQHTMRELSKTVTTDGIYGVSGNHDAHPRVQAAMEEFGIHMLANSGVHVREGFYVAGLEDFIRRSPNIARALEGAAGDDFVLLVSHIPDVTMKQDTSSVHLILSGHTHGGYITFFGLLAPALLFYGDYGQRFMSGWSSSRDGVPVYVSPGVGTYNSIPRVFARPRVIVMTLLTI